MVSEQIQHAYDWFMTKPTKDYENKKSHGSYNYRGYIMYAPDIDNGVHDFCDNLEIHYYNSCEINYIDLFYNAVFIKIHDAPLYSIDLSWFKNSEITDEELFQFSTAYSVPGVTYEDIKLLNVISKKLLQGQFCPPLIE